MSIIYGITEEKYVLNEKTRTSYGIVAYADSESDGTATIVAAARDISSDRERTERLVEECNEGELALCHFYDVIDDFLAE